VTTARILDTSVVIPLARGLDPALLPCHSAQRQLDATAESRARAFDTPIASIASAHDLPIYTANPTDFDLISDVVVRAVPSPG
jgi:hypothetical protein